MTDAIQTISVQVVLNKIGDIQKVSIKTLTYQYRSSYLYDGNSYTGKITSLYWKMALEFQNAFQNATNHIQANIKFLWHFNVQLLSNSLTVAICF